MPETVDWRTSDADAVLNRVAEAWSEGRLVVLPTEANYEASASALCADAVARLQSAAPSPIPALTLSHIAETHDWLPFVDGVAVRLLRRLPPAQWQLQANAGRGFGLLQRLPQRAQQALTREGFLTLRWPDLPLWWGAMRKQRGPIASVPLPALTGAEAAACVGHEALVIDAGPCPLGKPPTLVRVTGRYWQLMREGCLPAEVVAEAAVRRILFVCTGNTCRSPLAEALCLRMLADELGCAPQELKQRGFLVQSAGLAAMMGEEATPEAVAVAQAMGADLSQHRSQPITYELFAHADHVFAMTSSHLYALRAAGLDLAASPELLSPAGDDVADPLGGAGAVYEACAAQIREHLRQRIPAILQAI